MAIQKNHVILISLSLLLMGLFLNFYALPFLDGKNLFSLTYFYSQIGNFIPVLFGIYLVPVKIALLHKLSWFHIFSTPPVILGSITILVSLIVCILKRRDLSSMLLLCFFFTLIPTNTFIPKHQVILEWRLYPSLLFFILFLGSLLSKFSVTRSGRFSVVSIFTLMTCTYGSLTYHQNKIYQSADTTYQQVLKHYPNSLIAYNNYGYAYFRKGEIDVAEEIYKQGLLKNRCYEPILKSLAELYESQGDTMRAREIAFREKMCKKVYPTSPQHLS